MFCLCGGMKNKLKLIPAQYFEKRYPRGYLALLITEFSADLSVRGSFSNFGSEQITYHFTHNVVSFYSLNFFPNVGKPTGPDAPYHATILSKTQNKYNKYMFIRVVSILEVFLDNGNFPEGKVLFNVGIDFITSIFFQVV